MVSFESDYIAGAHPDILRRLAETNLEPLPGYGSDPYCERAKQKIRDCVGLPEAEVAFLAGGTQTNAVVISTLLSDWEGVLAAKTGHISSHEAGAIEYTGHEVLELPQRNGKIDPEDLRAYLSAYFADENHEHMTFPGMVYLSHPTEYGTLYSKAELQGISEICRQYSLHLYMDGARLAYGLMSRETDLSLREIAELCDVFYIGGTKVGALCGEAVVFRRGVTPRGFVTMTKQQGAMLAKGRLLGLQFDALFTDDLYWRISREAVELAMALKAAFVKKGYPLYADSPTNQQFVILTKEQKERLEKDAAFNVWAPLPDGRFAVRFVTSWATRPEDIEALRALL